MTTETTDTDTIAVTLPTNGRSTLREQGKSLVDVIADTADVDQAAAAESAMTVDQVYATYAGDSVGLVEGLEELPDDQSDEEDNGDRISLLDEAVNEATNEFAQTNGDAAESLDVIAEHWEAIFGHGVTEAQVIQCLATVELARINHNPNNRSAWRTIAALAAIGAEITGEI